MNDINLKLKLLAGSPFDVNNAGILYPFTIKDIFTIGYEKYAQIINLFMLDVKEYLSNDIENLENINAFDLIANSGDENLINIFTEAIKFIFRAEQVHFSLHFQSIFLGELNSDFKKNKAINHNNFLEIKEIIINTNCLNSKKNSEYNPKDNFANELANKFKKSRKIIDKLKKEDDGIDLADIISTVTVKSNSINKFNFFNLTLYQLYNEYKRLEVIDNYEVAIQSLLHGADNVKLKHWSSRIIE